MSFNFDKGFKVHRIQSYVDIDNVVGNFSDYHITRSDVVVKEKPIEVLPDKWVDPVKISEATEWFLLSELHPMFIELILSSTSMLERMKKEIVRYIQENDFNTMISYPFENKLLLNNHNGIWLDVRLDVQKPDKARVIGQIMLAMFRS